jgi:hypothetical protein
VLSPFSALANVFADFDELSQATIPTRPEVTTTVRRLLVFNLLALPVSVDPEEEWTASTSRTLRLKPKPLHRKRWIALSTLPPTLSRKLLSSLNLKDVLFATSLKLSSTAVRRNPTLKV